MKTEQDPPTQAIKEFQQILSDGERWKNRALVAEQKLQQAEAKVTSLEEFFAFRANAILKVEARLRVLTEALEPFAACEIESFGSMPDEKVFLWKPSQTGRDCPGISISDIKRARQALAAAKQP